MKTGLIESRRIIFTPDVDLKDELKNTAIQIIVSIASAILTALGATSCMGY